ncbi:MAG: hypothetical protein ABIZ49_01340, partial [Opitutaceae bacterium]
PPLSSRRQLRPVQELRCARGAYNTYFRIDPKEQIVVLLFVQLSPANNLELQYGFHNAAMQAIID